MRDLYMKDGHVVVSCLLIPQGFVLVYSINAQSTFNDIPNLREQLLRFKDKDDVHSYLIHYIVIGTNGSGRKQMSLN